MDSTDLTSDSQSDPGKRGSRIRLRGILLGLVLALVICAVTPFNNLYRQSTPLGGGHFPLAPFFPDAVKIIFFANGTISRSAGTRRFFPLMIAIEAEKCALCTDYFVASTFDIDRFAVN